MKAKLRKRVLTVTLLVLLISVGLMMAQSGISQQVSTLASARQQSTRRQQEQTDRARRKTLREIAKDRDIQTEVPDLENNAEYDDLRLLAKHAEAIVIGRIVKEESAFSGDDHLMTSYSVDVLRVVKDKTNEVIAILQLLGDPRVPAPLSTPLKVVRAGGVVYLDGHRVSARLKGTEALKSGEDYYIFFLHWSRDFGAYSLAGGASGAILVGPDLRVRPLGAEKGMTKYNGAHLESLIEEVLTAAK